MNLWSGLSLFKEGFYGGFCEHVDETSSSIKIGNFLTN